MTTLSDLPRDVIDLIYRKLHELNMKNVLVEIKTRKTLRNAHKLRIKFYCRVGFTYDGVDYPIDYVPSEKALQAIYASVEPEDEAAVQAFSDWNKKLKKCTIAKYKYLIEEKKKRTIEEELSNNAWAAAFGEPY